MVSLKIADGRYLSNLSRDQKSLFETLSVSLGLGEASGMAVAESRGFVFACDDKVAGREAGLLDVKLTGTLGIFKKAVRHNTIDLNEGRLILARMIETGFCIYLQWFCPGRLKALEGLSD